MKRIIENHTAQQQQLSNKVPTKKVIEVVQNAEPNEEALQAQSLINNLYENSKLGEFVESTVSKLGLIPTGKMYGVCLYCCKCRQIINFHTEQAQQNFKNIVTESTASENVTIPQGGTGAYGQTNTESRIIPDYKSNTGIPASIQSIWFAPKRPIGYINKNNVFGTRTMRTLFRQKQNVLEQNLQPTILSEYQNQELKSMNQGWLFYQLKQHESFCKQSQNADSRKVSLYCKFQKSESGNYYPILYTGGNQFKNPEVLTLIDPWLGNQNDNMHFLQLAMAHERADELLTCIEGGQKVCRIDMSCGYIGLSCSSQGGGVNLCLIPDKAGHSNMQLTPVNVGVPTQNELTLNLFTLKLLSNFGSCIQSVCKECPLLRANNMREVEQQKFRQINDIPVIGLLHSDSSQMKVLYTNSVISDKFKTQYTCESFIENYNTLINASHLKSSYEFLLTLLVQRAIENSANRLVYLEDEFYLLGLEWKCEAILSTEAAKRGFDSNNKKQGENGVSVADNRLVYVAYVLFQVNDLYTLKLPVYTKAVPVIMNNQNEIKDKFWAEYLSQQIWQHAVIGQKFKGLYLMLNSPKDMRQESEISLLFPVFAYESNQNLAAALNVLGNKEATQASFYQLKDSSPMYLPSFSQYQLTHQVPTQNISVSSLGSGYIDLRTCFSDRLSVSLHTVSTSTQNEIKQMLINYSFYSQNELENVSRLSSFSLCMMAQLKNTKIETIKGAQKTVLQNLSTPELIKHLKTEFIQVDMNFESALTEEEDTLKSYNDDKGDRIVNSRPSGNNQEYIIPFKGSNLNRFDKNKPGKTQVKIPDAYSSHIQVFQEPNAFQKDSFSYTLNKLTGVCVNIDKNNSYYLESLSTTNEKGILLAINIQDLSESSIYNPVDRSGINEFTQIDNSKNVPSWKTSKVKYKATFLELAQTVSQLTVAQYIRNSAVNQVIDMSKFSKYLKKGNDKAANLFWLNRCNSLGYGTNIIRGSINSFNGNPYFKRSDKIY